MILRSVVFSATICMDLTPFFSALLDGLVLVYGVANQMKNSAPLKHGLIFGKQLFQPFSSTERIMLQYKPII